MNTVIITTLLLCTGLLVVGCKEKIYSVEDFKKDPKLLEEWIKKCDKEKLPISPMKSSQNCQNLLTAARELVLEGFEKALKE